ncbi:MAG: hypothetical protein JNJ84_16030, partial [Rhodobacteraceae bacterium]|nr:hypothetical protein [Paracoccaceae bacterium]
MRLLRLVFETRFALLTWPVIGLVAALSGAVLLPGLHQTMALIAFALGLVVALGLYDVTQTRHAILRNYPVAAHLRFVLEGIRPEMRQYFFEGDKDGAPYPRDKRAIVYQRAKKELDKRPFGTQ